MAFFSKAKTERISAFETISLRTGNQDPDHAIIFFHGYGADASDLAPLAQELDVAKSVAWYFPNGPHQVSIGPGFWGRAWFPIPLAQLEGTMVRGEAMDFSQVELPEMDKTRKQAEEFLKRLPFSREQIVLGGFSQGAMLALDLVLNSAEPFSGLVLFSGTLVRERIWREQAAKIKEFSFFQSHGKQDTVLPFAAATRLNRMLIESGWRGKLNEFTGGHEIPGGVLSSASQYLQRVLDQGHS